ncbi:MAG: xanthine dehydrogenase family protein molybdopterin-binding subunit [Acidimicrobiaceae bacterium]|nr:xanthine dehydrogenase family protein molybdopterin-binding subunit [Acidimicrobiaceae bacterium]
MSIIAQRYTGSSIKRSEDLRILTGSGHYIDDVRLPGMLHAAFVRSPFAHARISSVEVSAAREVPGVVAVLTGAELEALIVPGPGAAGIFSGGITLPSFSQLATDKVRLVGDPVVLVVAESRYVAEDACELVEVDYEELPSVITEQQALDPDGPPIFEDLGSNVLNRTEIATFGDVEGAFARADRVVSAHLRQHRHQNVPMEGRGIACSYDPESGELTVYSANQGVQTARRLLAQALDVPIEKVRVLSDDIGGSFGLKMGASREEIAVAAAARHVGRPVRWIEDRTENLTASGQAREESFDVEAAVTNEGDILGLRVKMTIDTGAYPGMGGMLPRMVQNMLPGPYRIGALSFESTAIITNKATYVAYRGPWASETWVRERTIDLIAKELGLEPLAVRLRNVVTRGEPPLAMVTGRSLAGVTARESLERVSAMVDFGAFRERQAEARAQGRYLGLGLATYIEAAPGPRQPQGGGIGGPEQIRMRLEDDGTVSVFTAQMPHGQSHQTTFAQVAADEFGVPFEQVRVVVGDSSQVPQGFGTGGSRAAVMAGGASLHGARALKKRVQEVGSHLFEAAVEDMLISDGVLSVQGVPARAMSLAEVAKAAHEPGRLPEDVSGDIEVTTAFDGGEGGWSGGSHAAIVEVDTETGLVRIERYLVAEDCGALINPAIVEGQVRGGVAQGIGAVLLERSAYDPESGQFLASTFMDYLLPTAWEIPRLEIEHLETVPLDADVNFRGVGEGGMIIAPPTLCNAIEDALAPFAARVTEQHLPPNRILELIGAILSDAGEPR